MPIGCLCSTSLLLLVFSLGCGDRQTADAGPVTSAPAALPTPQQAASLPLVELRAHIDALDGQPAAQALGQARMLRVLALREGDGALLRRARRSLSQARQAEGEVGCAAGLELARLEARDAWDESAARAAAASVVSDYGAAPERAACVAEARRLVETLAGLEVESQGTPAELAALDVLGESEGASSVRLVLRMSGAAAVERRREAGDGADRLELRFRSLHVPEALVGSRRVETGGLRRVTTQALDTGALVTLDLTHGAEVSVFSLADPDRLVLDIARHATPTQANAGPPRLIVLDPGHGGNDWGARYEGLEESDLVLDIAARAARSLAVLMPHTRVMLTRQQDRFLDLPSRTAMANALAADLFVSIHLNSADDAVTHGGVTTFVLDTGNERQALRLAARENGTTTGDVGQLSRVIAHLYRREQVAASRALAAEVQAATLAAARRSLPSLPDRGVQQAMFHVLVGARMPAVLVEASFLTEPREAAQLRRPRYRQDLADGIARGIARHAATGM